MNQDVRMYLQDDECLTCSGCSRSVSEEWVILDVDPNMRQVSNVWCRDCGGTNPGEQGTIDELTFNPETATGEEEDQEIGEIVSELGRRHGSLLTQLSLEIRELDLRIEKLERRLKLGKD